MFAKDVGPDVEKHLICDGFSVSECEKLFFGDPTVHKTVVL